MRARTSPSGKTKRAMCISLINWLTSGNSCFYSLNYCPLINDTFVSPHSSSSTSRASPIDNANRHFFLAANSKPLRNAKLFMRIFLFLTAARRPQWKPQATRLSLDRLTAMPFQRVWISADSLNHSLSIFLIENRVDRTAPFATCFYAFNFFFFSIKMLRGDCALRKTLKFPLEREQHDPKIAQPNKKLTWNTSNRTHISRFPFFF